MKSAVKILFCIIFGGVFVSHLPAQTILKNGKIPKDLVINYEFYGRFCGSELKISSDRRLRLHLISCLLQPADFAPYEVGKKDKLPKEKLKQLIAEFEKINFFSLNEEYSPRQNSCKSFLTDSGRAKISIQINGKTKQIAYEIGCMNEKDTPVEQLKLLGGNIYQMMYEAKIRITSGKQKLN
jgi:hypothetical protein